MAISRFFLTASLIFEDANYFLLSFNIFRSESAKTRISSLKLKEQPEFELHHGALPMKAYHQGI